MGYLSWKTKGIDIRFLLTGLDLHEKNKALYISY